MTRHQRETPKRVVRAWNETVRAWQAMQPLDLLGADQSLVPVEPRPVLPGRMVRPIDPAERDRWRREIERRAAMVRGMTPEQAALVFYRAGEQELPVLQVLGVEP